MKTIVYSTEVCPFCIQAKKLLSLKGIEYDEMLVVKDENAPKKLADNQILKSSLQDKVRTVTGETIHTVPQIFLDGEYIGGFTDLVEHFNSERDEFLKNHLKTIEV